MTAPTSTGACSPPTLVSRPACWCCTGLPICWRRGRGAPLGTAPGLTPGLLAHTLSMLNAQHYPTRAAEAAKDVVLAEKPTISGAQDALEPALLRELLGELGSLASV